MTKLLSNPVIAVLLLVALIAVCILVLNVAFGPTMERVEWREETYRVQSGDSLWIISRDYCPENVDRREWIEEVQALNGLTSSFIYPGQQLTVLAPVEEV
jgi:hypothetical protein